MVKKAKRAAPVVRKPTKRAAPAKPVPKNPDVAALAAALGHVLPLAERGTNGPDENVVIHEARAALRKVTG